jgi:predicted nucleic acid-binding protein
LSEILNLARREGITSYDAAYLDLALREGLPLATRDAALAEAARRVGVSVIAA